MSLTDLIFGWQGAVAAEFILIWVAIYFVFMRPRRTGPPRSDSRYHNRFHSKFRGWLRCNGKRLDIRGVDLNKSGALVASRAPLAPGSHVFLYIESQGLMGSAVVRHCAHRRTVGYHIGLEFRGALIRAMEGNWQFSSVTQA